MTARLYGISEHDYFEKVKRLNEKGDSLMLYTCASFSKSQKDNETGS